MDDKEISAQAQALYEAGHSVRPRWDQLGDTTKGVWKGYVLSGSFYIKDQQGDPPCFSTAPSNSTET